MSPVRIGIIGTGVGLRTLLPGFRTVADAKVIALCGSSKERTDYFALKHSIPVACQNYQELCSRDDIDLVCVTSPNLFHYEHTKIALENGKHVLCEKPFTMKRSDMEQLILKRDDLGVLGLINHQLRFNPYIVKIRDLITSGQIGKPYYVQVHQQSMNSAANSTNWSWSFDATQGGGVRYAMCSHFADLLNFWFQAKYYNMSAHMEPVFTSMIDSNGITHSISASTFCRVSLELEGEISVDLSVTAGAYSFPRFDINIYGEKGEIRFDLNNKLELYTIKDKGIKQKLIVPNVFDDEKENQISIFSGSFRYFAPDIIHAIKNNDFDLLKNASKFEDARYTFRFLEDIGISANNSIIINPLKASIQYT
jgi:predicted dehydrogenase